MESAGSSTVPPAPISMEDSPFIQASVSSSSVPSDIPDSTSLGLPPPPTTPQPASSSLIPATQDSSNGPSPGPILLDSVNTTVDSTGYPTTIPDSIESQVTEAMDLEDVAQVNQMLSRSQPQASDDMAQTGPIEDDLILPPETPPPPVNPPERPLHSLPPPPFVSPVKNSAGASGAPVIIVISDDEEDEEEQGTAAAKRPTTSRSLPFSSATNNGRGQGALVNSSSTTPVNGRGLVSNIATITDGHSLAPSSSPSLPVSTLGSIPDPTPPKSFAPAPDVKTSLVPPQIFAGLTLWFVAPPIVPLRAKIFTARAKERGAAVETSPSPAVTHVISKSTSSVEELQASMDDSSLLSETVSYHTAEWITVALQSGRRCPDDKFLLPSFKKSTPVPDKKPDEEPSGWKDTTVRLPRAKQYGPTGWSEKRAKLAAAKRRKGELSPGSPERESSASIGPNGTGGFATRAHGVLPSLGDDSPEDQPPSDDGDDSVLERVVEPQNLLAPSTPGPLTTIPPSVSPGNSTQDTPGSQQRLPPRLRRRNRRSIAFKRHTERLSASLEAASAGTLGVDATDADAEDGDDDGHEEEDDEEDLITKDYEADSDDGGGEVLNNPNPLGASLEASLRGSLGEDDEAEFQQQEAARAAAADALLQANKNVMGAPRPRGVQGQSGLPGELREDGNITELGDVFTTDGEGRTLLAKVLAKHERRARSKAALGPSSTSSTATSRPGTSGRVFDAPSDLALNLYQAAYAIPHGYNPGQDGPGAVGGPRTQQGRVGDAMVDVYEDRELKRSRTKSPRTSDHDFDDDLVSVMAVETHTDPVPLAADTVSERSARYLQDKGKLWACQNPVSAKEADQDQRGRVGKRKKSAGRLGSTASVRGSELGGKKVVQDVNYNTHITGPLKACQERHAALGNKMHVLGYQKAITVLTKWPSKITRAEDVKHAYGVGPKTLKKIEEILMTGQLARLETVDEYSDTIAKFSQVWGAGPATCKRWWSMGMRSLEDLAANPQYLTDQQQVGLKYYHDFTQRISRDEVDIVNDYAKAMAVAIKPGLQAIICGSYRRGRDSCGDIDVLITHKDGRSHFGALPEMIERMKKEGFIVADLAMGEDGTKFMGAYQLPGRPARRIDLLTVPWHEIGASILYFTGSGHFNRSMRHWANKLGYSLSQHGLVPVVRVNGDKVQEGAPIPGLFSEADIFRYLNLKYIPPNERNV